MAKEYIWIIVFIDWPAFRNDPNIEFPDYYLFADQPNSVGTNATMYVKYTQKIDSRNGNFRYGGLHNLRQLMWM